MSGLPVPPEEESWLELEPVEIATKSDVEIVGLGSDSEVEEIEVVCCDEIKISSDGLVASLFPALPGNYSKLVESSTSPVWKHQSSHLYISKPQSSKKVRKLCQLWRYFNISLRATAGA